MRKNPPMRAESRPGPAYDPMDRIVEDMENIDAFLSYLAQKHNDPTYFQTHYPKILGLRKGLDLQIDLLSGEPYGYHPARVNLLKKENEKLFSLMEGLAGAMDPLDNAEFQRFMKACVKELSQFDNDLTP
jgi:hypothetical protein